MDTYTIEAEVRNEKGKGDIRRLRTEGFLPGVVYGRNQQNYMLKFPTRILNRLLAKGFSYNIPIELILNTGSETITLTAFVKEIQQDPVTGTPYHIDFYAVAQDQKIILPIDIVGKGIPEGTEKGGIVQQLAADFLAEGLVNEIPRQIEVDITHLQIGDLITLGQLEIPENLRVIDSDDKVLFQVFVAKKQYIDELGESEAESEAEAEAEPEAEA